MKTTLAGLALLFGMTAGMSAHGASIINLSTVQSEITKNHAGWKAKDTWLNGLTQTEITRMMGLQVGPKGHLDFTAADPNSTNPSSLDWRNQNGINWLGAVMNQGNCGSCVAF